MERREAKIEREQKKQLEKLHMQQMSVENKKWAAVDKSDAKHMQKASEKRKKDADKEAKKKEKRDLLVAEEA
jgi:hypothetical protein